MVAWRFIARSATILVLITVLSTIYFVTDRIKFTQLSLEYYDRIQTASTVRPTKQVRAKNFTILPPRKPGDDSRYVSLCHKMLYGNHRMGNQLFMLAAMLDLANRTGRRVVMPTDWRPDTLFDIDLERVNNVNKDLCPCISVVGPNYDYDGRFDDKKFIDSLIAAKKQTIVLCQLSQTYQHAQKVETELRNLLSIKPKYVDFAQKYREELKLKNECQEGKCKQVGIHVRGGDFLSRSHHGFGLTVVNYGYLKNGMQHFVNVFGSVQFILTTDDWKFTDSILGNLTSQYNVVKSLNHTAEEDFALVASLDGVLMSTGSFGWWEGWLSDRLTVYYKDWPRAGSRLHRLMPNTKGYFLPEWIPLL